MPRATKQQERPLPSKSLVVDNGGYTIKAGFVADNPTEDDCHVIPNCIARDRGKRLWVGSQLEKCNDFGEIAFRRPVEKGYLVNWEAEKAIWDQTFIEKSGRLQCDPQETNLILTESPNTPAALQANTDQIVFEEYEFASYYRCIGPSLNAYNDIAQLFEDGVPGAIRSHSPAECVLVIDSGFSHTTIAPILHGRPIQQAIRRLDIGGKFLTNYLKELVSIRHYNMLDEVHLMNEVKESICFVSQDYKRDLQRTWKGSSTTQKTVREGERDIVVDYVLPDYNSHKKGYARPHDPSLNAKLRKIGAMTGPSEVAEDFMTLGNERFTVPELLFNPMDVGSRQPGIAETAIQSLSAVPTGLWPVLLANILVVGGNTKIDGFMPRIEAEIRQLAPAECVVRVAKAEDPIKSTWLGGARVAGNRAALSSLLVTRQQYQENGSAWLAKVFSGPNAR
ncbi:uncharacterized protein KY384_005438 [Bacidia gigantensis]|uniref:uncharacterized protein n=1 Tax=Bacidia gigantensis TaxID=2732470 RepID=UPI001D037D87|nr:uncharacterized protein KY384_005438 [Bacidia gigantensis]KAG8529957.1 hypothetical protein KY384_005438 [Bacidia gigantensis]